MVNGSQTLYLEIVGRAKGGKAKSERYIQKEKILPCCGRKSLKIYIVHNFVAENKGGIRCIDNAGGWDILIV